LRTLDAADSVETPLDSAHFPRVFALSEARDPKSDVEEEAFARNAWEGALGVKARAEVAERSARVMESFMLMRSIIESVELLMSITVRDFKD